MAVANIVRSSYSTEGNLKQLRFKERVSSADEKKGHRMKKSIIGTEFGWGDGGTEPVRGDERHAAG